MDSDDDELPDIPYTPMFRRPGTSAAGPDHSQPGISAESPDRSRSPHRSCLESKRDKARQRLILPLEVKH